MTSTVSLRVYQTSGSATKRFELASRSEYFENRSITKTQSDYGGTVDPFTDITFLRSSLDGVGIDFDAESYADITSDDSISTIQESKEKSGDTNSRKECKSNVKLFIATNEDRFQPTSSVGRSS